MTAAVTLEELLIWNEESAAFWKAHFDANPALLELPCGIDSAPTVQELDRHNWVAELRWAQRVAGLPITAREDLPRGPLDALFARHLEAARIFRVLLADPETGWDETLTMEYDWLPPQVRTASRRKMAAHGLLHSQRHWAQLATLIRTAGFPTGFHGDLIFSLAL
jgi:hypothetical protein